MVGVAGVLGADASLPSELGAWTEWGDEETDFEFSADGVEFRLTGHDLLAGDQPAVASAPEEADGGEVRIWVWGDVYGHGPTGAYEPRDGPPDGSARYCADLYTDHGMAFVDELNGDYALVVYDPEQGPDGTLSFVTDRLGTHPIYVARPTDDTLVFASTLQALPAHPAVPAALETEYLLEYLELRRVFGVETPLAGVRELQPACVTSVDLADLSVSTRSYWDPRYAPVERPFADVVRELAETMQTVLAEWTREDLDYGLLLSGGSDSRLLAAAFDQDVVAFHNADWMSREAAVAREVSEAAGDEFRLLERYDDHEARTLEHTPQLSNFSGWFDQAYFSEFEAEITDSVDVLVSGLFADMLFAGGPLETYDLSLGPVGELSLPFRNRIADLDDYVAAKQESVRPLPYFTPEHSLESVLRDNVEWTANGVRSHGVEYASLLDLVMYGDYYPHGADTEAIFTHHLMQMRPYRTPFFDKRIIDLHRSIPLRYFLRRNIVNSAVGAIDPDLAAIPHARNGVSLANPFPVEFAGRNLHGLYRKYVGEPETPAPHLNHKPWPNRRELLRAKSFARETLTANEDLVRSLSFLDHAGAERTLAEHEAGADNHTVIYSLLTLLEMPLTEQVATASTADALAESPGGSSGRPGEDATGELPPSLSEILAAADGYSGPDDADSSNEVDRSLPPEPEGGDR